MGLFSKKKTIIDSSSQLLIEETPNLVKDSIVNAVLNNRGIADDIVANYLDSLHMKGKQLRRYAKNNYTYGLPNGTVNYATPKDDLVRVVLKSILGTNVLIISNLVDIADSFRFSLPHLESIGYDSETRIVADPPFDTESTVFFYSSIFLNSNQIEITYEYTDYYGNHTETEIISCDNVDTQSVYYHTVYYPINGKGEIIGDKSYWFYNPNTEVYSVLNLPKDLVEESQYYPIVPIRENKVNLTDSDHQNTELYKTSKRVLNFWDIGIQDVGDAVHASPDINDVDHAYIIAGVDIQDDNEYVLAYLHEYFSYLYDRSKFGKSDYDYWLSGEKNSPPAINTVTIQDANYRMDLNYYYIDITYETGSIGDVGDIERIINSGGRITSNNNNYAYEQSDFIIKKQITPTYIEVVSVSGLYHINYVYPNNTVDTSLRDALNDEDDKNNFIIPINIDVANNLSLLHANSLMYYSIRIVYNSKITKKLKWYETGFFQIFIKVVAIILTVYGLYTVGQALVTAASVGVAALAQVVIQSVLISVAVNIAMDFLVNVIGLEGALVVTLIAMAAAYASGNPSFNTVGSLNLPTSIDMLQITNAFMGAYQSEVSDAIEDVYSEIEDFQEYAQEMLDDLEDLGGSDLITPYSLSIISTSQGMYETAEEFIERTTYTDNIGALALETPSTFVDRLLKLDVPENEIRTQV